MVFTKKRNRNNQQHRKITISKKVGSEASCWKVIGGERGRRDARYVEIDIKQLWTYYCSSKKH